LNELDKILHQDILNPATLWGALFYGTLSFITATVLAGLLRLTVHKALNRDQDRLVDRTYALFLAQLGQISIYVIIFILYTHLIPPLHSLATALLTGASVVSIVVGLAAQGTLGNLVSGIAVVLYRPFRVGDTIQVIAPKGFEIGVVEKITLGYTVLVTEDHRRVMMPNSLVLTQTTVNLTDSDSSARSHQP